MFQNKKQTGNECKFNSNNKQKIHTTITNTKKSKTFPLFVRKNFQTHTPSDSFKNK